MTSTFLDCLALTLQRETGYRQPVGGPYRRAADGAVLAPPGRLRTPTGEFRPIPSKLEDLPKHERNMAFDDDAADTGGRTGMGILQREFDAWCRARGKEPRDVWSIADNELEAIYAEQYWTALRCDELPAGVRLAVFDAGVNCGVGRAVRFLQAALGVAVDGHIGAVTIARAAEADAVPLIERLRQVRAAYHRQCRTFRIHGRNWLERTDWIATRARAMAEAAAVSRRDRIEPPPRWATASVSSPPAAEDEPETVEASRSKARPVEKTPGTSVTVWTSVVSGTGAFLVALREMLTALGPAIESPTFWLGLGLIGLAIVVAGERIKRFASEMFA